MTISIKGWSRKRIEAKVAEERETDDAFICWMPVRNGLRLVAIPKE